MSSTSECPGVQVYILGTEKGQSLDDLPLMAQKCTLSLSSQTSTEIKKLPRCCRAAAGPRKGSWGLCRGSGVALWLWYGPQGVCHIA